MNADLARLMDNLRVRVPGAVDGALQLEFFAVMNEFFQDSNLWYEDIDFAVTSGVTNYSITSTSVSTINRLMGVVNSAQQDVRAYMAVPGEIQLAIQPSQDDTFTARVALTVTDPVTRDGYPEFPDWVLNKYNSGIQDGVLGRMFSQVAKPYSNERMSIFHMRRFEQAKAQAKVEAQHQNVYRGQNWKFPQTFARRKWR
jgi:hypothetical protein